jgi:iron complex outermembrane receptor protein
MSRYVSSATLALMVGSVLHAASAGAQTAPAADTAPAVIAAPAEAPGGGVEEVIVTAQRRSESLERTPISVAVLGSETLAKNAITTETDLVSAVPGLIVKAGQSSNQLNYSLRGQTVDAFSSSRPSVLPYFNEVQVGGSGASAFYDLQSVQVLKGPQGTLFGRNSTGGAVLLTSAKPTNDFEGYGSVRLGDYDMVQVEGALNLPLVDDKVLMRIAAFYEKRDGYQENRFNGETLGDVDRKHARLSLTVNPTDTISNEFVFDYAQSRGNNLSSVVYNVFDIGEGNPFVPANFLYSPLSDTALGTGHWEAFLAAHPGADPDGLVEFAKKQAKRGPFDISVDAPNYHESDDYIITNITTFEVGDETQIKNIIGYVDRDTIDASEFDGSPYPSDDNGEGGRGGPLEQLSEELQILGKGFDGKLDYIAGIYYSDEELYTFSESDLFDLSPTAPETVQINEGTTKNETYAVYGQGTYDLSESVHEGLSVSAGLRYSEEEVSFEHGPQDAYMTSPRPEYVNPLSDTFKKTSWLIGVQQQVTDDVLVYLKSRRSFRSGGFNFFAPPLPGFGNDGGAEYMAETATDIEFGTKFLGEIGSVPTRMNLAVYTMTIDDIQRSNYVQIFGALAGITVNVPEARVNGVEFDGTISPTDWLTLGMSVNYTDAEFTENEVSVLGNPSVAFGPYPDTPEWSGTLFAEGRFALSGTLSASIRGDVYNQTSSWVSSTGDTLNPGTEIDGYTIANFRAGIDSDTGWSLSASVKNAFDETYYVGGIGFASLFAINTVIPGAPRTYFVEARYRF